MTTAQKFYQTTIFEFIEEVEVKPELTAINTRNSKTAERLAGDMEGKKLVLDYGCGTGRNAKYIVENSEAIVLGTDIEEQMDRSEGHHKKIVDTYSKDRVGFLPSSVFEGKFHNVMDACICSHVLNVVDEKNIRVHILNEIFKALKIGGKLYLEVRTKSDVESAKTKVAYKDGYLIRKGKETFTFQKAFGKDELKELVESLGFKVEEHQFNSSIHMIVASK